MIRSKKFIAFLLGVAVLAAKDLIGIDPDTATKIVGIVGTYLLGQGFSDGMTGGLTSSLPGTPQWTPPFDKAQGPPGAGPPNG